MNPTQRHILLLALLVALGMLLVPPHRVAVIPLPGAEEPAGLSITYRFILSPRFSYDESATRDVLGIAWPLMRVQFQWHVLFTFLLLILFRTRNRGGGGDGATTSLDPMPSPVAERVAE